MEQAHCNHKTMKANDNKPLMTINMLASITANSSEDTRSVVDKLAIKWNSMNHVAAELITSRYYFASSLIIMNCRRLLFSHAQVRVDCRPSLMQRFQGYDHGKQMCKALQKEVSKEKTYFTLFFFCLVLARRSRDKKCFNARLLHNENAFLEIWFRAEISMIDKWKLLCYIKY